MAIELPNSENLSKLERQPSAAFEIMQQYLSVLQGTDLQAYNAAQGMITTAMHLPSEYWSGNEIHTSGALRAIEEADTVEEHLQSDVYLYRPIGKNLKDFLDERRASALAWRSYAASHMVREMLQGDAFPHEEVDMVIVEVADTHEMIHGSKESAAPFVDHTQKEILEVWSNASKSVERQLKDDSLKNIRSNPKYLQQIIKANKAESIGKEIDTMSKAVLAYGVYGSEFKRKRMLRALGKAQIRVEVATTTT